MEDRRKSNRIDAHEACLGVRNAVDDEPIGIIGNLSIGGMMLIASQQFYPNGILQLDIDVPEEANTGPISMGVKILWCIPANSPDEFWAGLETLDISKDSHAALERLLDYLSEAV